MTEQTDWRQSNHLKWLASRKIWSVEELGTSLRAQSQGRHTFDRLEENGVERRSDRQTSLKGRERPSSGSPHWNRFKGNFEETSKRSGRAHMGFSERIYTILDWTELNWHGSAETNAHVYVQRHYSLAEGRTPRWNTANRTRPRLGCVKISSKWSMA